MKIAGRKIEGLNRETIVIPRPGEPIVFTAQAVIDYAEFDALCPRPQPPVKLLPGGRRVSDDDAPTYKDAIKDWADRRFAWTILKSLEATVGLEWDTVVIGDPSTWTKYEDELKASGLSPREVLMLTEGVLAANALSQDRLDKAREAFLASQEVVADES